MKQVFSFFIVVVILAACISSCKKDDAPTAPSGGATAYVGTLGNSVEAGTMTLTFASAPPKTAPLSAEAVTAIINVSGTVKFGGTTITLSGTFNTDNDSLIVSGGGYSFRGVLVDGNISGEYTGPNGSGSFTTESSTEEGSVKVYVGTSHETSPDTTQHGRFLLVVKGNAITGITDSGLKLAGTITGTNVSVHFVIAPDVELAHGTISGDGTSMQGEYSFTDEGVTRTGTWTATRQ